MDAVVCLWTVRAAWQSMGHTQGMDDDDGLDWDGPPCPACSHEMNADVVETAHGLKACQRCPACGLVLLVPDPFAID